MKSLNTSTGRLIIADDNIRDVGGHFFELAGLLLAGANQLGYQGVLATHASFAERQAVQPGHKVIPTFHARRLVHWSLGVDGHSRFQRDGDGKSIGGGPVQNAWTNLADRVRPKRRPLDMLRQWSDDLARLLTDLKPTPSDSLLINTGDDFALLALAAAMRKCRLERMRIDVIFHFALYHADQLDRRQRLRQIGRQIRWATADLQAHDLHLHATTHNLAAQLRETESGATINPIPYPTRVCKLAAGASTRPWKVVLAGLPRAEKGRGAIIELLTAMETSALKQHRFRVSLQMPAQRWQAMVPVTLHGAYQRAVAGSDREPIEVMTDNLSTQAYHAWLDTADIGVFLYEPDRYVARCSGVLLEMLARGVPVIVPDHCWLADQVRLAGGHRSIGFIYQDRAEIPDLLTQFSRHREAIQRRSLEHAAKIGQQHNGKNTLLEMGLPPLRENAKVA